MTPNSSKLPPGSPAGETASEGLHGKHCDAYVVALGRHCDKPATVCQGGKYRCDEHDPFAVPEPVPTEGAAELRKRAEDFIDGLARYPYTARLENPYREIAIAMKFQEMSAAPIAPAAEELIQELVTKVIARGCGCYSNSKDDWHIEGCPVPVAKSVIARAEEYRKGAKNA